MARRVTRFATHRAPSSPSMCGVITTTARKLSIGNSQTAAWVWAVCASKPCPSSAFISSAPHRPCLSAKARRPAKALRDMGVAAVGTVTGAAGCPSEDSLRPLLGRALALWPDTTNPA